MPATLAPTRTTSTSTDLPTCSVYVRISRDTERTRLGVDRQMKGCRELAARLGYRIAATYDDNDTSAYSGKKRKGYLRMLDDLERNPTPVLVWHTDRLHRSPLELEGWINLAEANNITVHTVISGPIDLATPAGRMNARQVVANAKYESEIKSLRLKDKMVEKAEFGEWLGGSRPFGWQFIDPTVKPRRLELNPAEAELIATGIRTLLAGGSLRVVVRDFTASKVPPPYATAWHRRSVRTILRRWRNAGLLEHRGQIVGPAEWPAIPGVSADDVKAVRELLAERAEGNNYGNKADWLLSGIAYCHCGEHVRATSNRPDRMTYRCVTAGRGHVAKAIEPVDELVNTFMVAWLSDPDRFATRYAATATTGVDVAALRVERDRAQARLGDLGVMLANDEITRQEFTDIRRRVIERVEKAERELIAATRTSPASAMASSADPVAAWDAADLDVKRAILREIVTITLLPTGGGRRPFNPDTVRIEPRK